MRLGLAVAAMCWLAPVAMAETPRYLDYCCSEITPPPANYGRSGGHRGVIVDPDSTDPSCYKTIGDAYKAVRAGGTIWVKPNNKKTLIESLTLRKPVKIRRYVKSEVDDARGVKKCNLAPGLGQEYVRGLNRDIAEMEKRKKASRDKQEQEQLQKDIDRLEGYKDNYDRQAYYRIQPVSGEYCAKVSLKNWKGWAEISGASFVPPPQGEQRTMDCIYHTSGNLTVSDSRFEGSSGFFMSGRASYRAIVIKDGSATITGNSIENLKSGVVVNHEPNIHENRVSTTPRERNIVITENWISDSTENAIAILAPVNTSIKNNKLIFTQGQAPTGPVSYAGITTYGKGPICGNWIELHPIGIVHYGSGELTDNTIVENGTGVSLRIDNQKPDEKFRLYNNIIAGNKKVGLSAPRGSIQEHDAAYIERLYNEGREEEIYKNDRGDSTYFNGNRFCNRTNVFRMRDLPPNARRANTFKGGRAWGRRCEIPPLYVSPPRCSLAGS